MSPQRTAKARLEDIVLWGSFVAGHIAGMDQAAFDADLKTQHAVMKCIEVIGEASAQLMKLMPDHALALPGLDLRSAYAIRNKLSHGYHETEVDRLWNAASEWVPKIVVAAKAALANFDDGTAE